MNARKIKIAASFAAATLALSGCNVGNAETPTQHPSKETSASPSKASQSPTPTPSNTNEYKPASAAGPAENVPIPKMPADAKEYSEEGAAAFTKYYFDLVNYSIETNDADPLKKVTTKDCIVCGVSIIDEATEAKKVGKWQVGGKHHPKILDSYITGDKLAAVTVEYTADRAKIYLGANDLSAELDELEPTTVAIGVSFDQRWQVYEIVGSE